MGVGFAFVGLVVLLTLGLAAGPAGAVAGVVVAGVVAAVVVLGATRVGIVAMMGAFATAPAYKGIVPSADTVTPTDLLLVAGFGLLLPRILSGRVRVPLVYVVGAAIVGVAALISTIGSDERLVAALGVTFWVGVLVGLPVAVNLWSPPSKVIRVLCWSYVVGQLVTWAIGTAMGHVSQGRYYGLTQHPNYFAEAGLMCVCLLIYLYFQYDGFRARAFVVLAGAACVLSVLVSGSRGATLVLAVIAVMIPVVERSAVAGFVWAMLGGLAIALSPLLLKLTGSASSIDRLLGGGSASGSDLERSQGLKNGWAMFGDHPWFGGGLVSTDLFLIHNNYLEVLVAVGAVGMLGYALILFGLLRPLFSNHAHRRLSYTAWAYLGWGVSVPALYDRSIWIPIMLTAVCWIPSRAVDDDDAPTRSGVSPEAVPEGV